MGLPARRYNKYVVLSTAIWRREERGNRPFTGSHWDRHHISMIALKSTLAKAALADSIAKQQLRQYRASRSPIVIELNGKRYKPEYVPSADNVIRD